MRTPLSVYKTIILCLFSLVVHAQNGYKNPVIPGFYSDPSVCRAGDDYYLVHSSFSYFPGVPIFHSKDLINWEQIGHVLTTKTQLPLEDKGPIKGSISGGIFAPTIRFHDGVFYMITTNINELKNFLVTATNPAGPWSEPVWIDMQGKFAIDPSLFFDEDGRVYFTTAPGLLAQIDVKSGKLTTPLQPIWSGTGGWSPEGPHIYKKDGWYYLLMSEGGTEYGHKLVIARSKKIDGPYISNPANPILTHLGISTLNSPIQGVGHADFVQATDGSWWTVAHGFRPRSMHHILGRETLLAPVEWPQNEWPVINKTGTLALDMKVPTLPQHPYPKQPTKDDFTAPALAFQWNHINNPVTTNYSLSARPGFLRLKGNTFTLTSGKEITFVGRRQQHETFTASTRLDFNPANQSDEAGLTVFMDFKHHYDLSIKQIDGKRVLLLTYSVGMIKHVEKQIPLTDGPVELIVEGSVSEAGFFAADSYTFSFRQGNGSVEKLAKADAKYLSTETAGGFTGVYLGMFATGNGQPSGTNADFDWFEYSANQRL